MNNQFAVVEKVREESRTKSMVVSGLLIALVFVSTMFINVRLPISINGGLIHFGTAALFVSSILFGKKKGAISGAFGMGLFDILSGWAAWAPFTFVVRGVMGYIIGSISNAGEKNGDSMIYNLLAIFAGSVWMIIGYYITEVILYGNWLAPMTSIPGNAAQIILGLIVALPLTVAFKRNRFLRSIL